MRTIQRSNPLQDHDNSEDTVSIMAEVLVSENVRSKHSPRPVMERVVRAMQGDAGDDLSEEQHKRFDLSRRVAKFTVSRFELESGSIFVLIFLDASGVFVATLKDLEDILRADASKPHPFDLSANRVVIRSLIPLREGEALDISMTPEDAENDKAMQHVLRLATVLSPSDVVKPELN